MCPVRGNSGWTLVFFHQLGQVVLEPGVKVWILLYSTYCNYSIV